MINHKTGTKVEAARTTLYQFLTLIFYEPSFDLLEDLAQKDNLSMLSEASELYLGQQHKKLITGLLDTLLNKDETAFFDLKVEYTRLFIGPMAPACPPYESVFDKSRQEEWQGTMAGPTADAMAELLRKEGLGLTLDYAELPDHVAIELEFMYYLLSRAYSGEENSAGYLEKANDFLMGHLAKWLPEFGDLLFQKSQLPFYQSIGLLLQAVIIADLEFVN